MSIYEKSHRAHSWHLFPRRRRRQKVNVPDRGNYGPDYDLTRSRPSGTDRQSLSFHIKIFGKRRDSRRIAVVHYDHNTLDPRPCLDRTVSVSRRPILTCIFGVRPRIEEINVGYYPNEKVGSRRDLSTSPCECRLS